MIQRIVTPLHQLGSSFAGAWSALWPTLVRLQLETGRLLRCPRRNAHRPSLRPQRAGARPSCHAVVGARCAVCTLGPPDGQRHSIFPLRMPTDHRLRRMTNRYRLSPLSSSPPLMSSATRSALPVFRHHAGMSRQLPWSVLMSSNASPGATWWAALLASTTGPGQNRPEASTMRTGTSCSVEVLGAGTFSLTFPLPESAWLRSFRSTAWYRHRGPSRSRTR